MNSEDFPHFSSQCTVAYKFCVFCQIFNLFSTPLNASLYNSVSFKNSQKKSNKNSRISRVKNKYKFVKFYFHFYKIFKIF